jgi:c-di-GMP-binding flagellar brake protein YcgR
MVYEIKPRVPNDWAGEELRKAPRLKISVPGIFSRRYYDNLSIMVEDISVGGVRVKLISKSMPISIGTSGYLDVKFGRVKDGEILENVGVKLVWERGSDSKKELGFQFTSLSEELKEIIARFIKKGVKS